MDLWARRSTERKAKLGPAQVVVEAPYQLLGARKHAHVWYHSVEMSQTKGNVGFLGVRLGTKSPGNRPYVLRTHMEPLIPLNDHQVLVFPNPTSRLECTRTVALPADTTRAALCAPPLLPVRASWAWTGRSNRRGRSTRCASTTTFSALRLPRMVSHGNIWVTSIRLGS